MASITLPGAAGGAEISVDISAFPESIREALMLHGLQQKVADSVANAKKEGWTEAECRDRCNAVLESLKAGTWGRKASGPRARDEDSYIRAGLARKIKATAKAKNASEPSGEALERLVAAVMASDKPNHVTLVAALRAEWNAKRATTDFDLDSL